MMKIFAKTRIWIICALAVAVIGFAFLGIFGLNQTPDFKPSYEVTVAVDQNAGDSAVTLKTATDDYFAEKGYKPVGFATQKVNDSATLIYKFDNEIALDKAELKSEIETALGATTLQVSVEYKETAVTSGANIGAYIGASLIALAAMFIVLTLVYKLASAVTAISNALITALLFIAAVALFRIPASPFFGIGIAFAAVVSVAVTVSLADRYKAALKAEDHPDIASIAQAGAEKAFNGIVYLCCAVCCFAVALAVVSLICGSVALCFAALQILISAVIAVAVNCVCAPSLWKALKSVAKK